MSAGHVPILDAVTRRAFLGAGGVSAVLAAGSSVFAQQPAPVPPAPRAKGPSVWLDMDQAELDAAYDQIKYAPNLLQIVERYATNSEAVRGRLGAPRRYAYGPTPLETPEFQRQSRDFAGAVKAAGKPVQLLVVEGYNHLEIPETLANPFGLLGRAVLAQMNLSRG